LLQPHVLWIDNYSKFYTVNVHSARNEKGYKDCLWAAEGVSPCHQPQVLDDENEEQAAVVRRPFSFKLTPGPPAQPNYGTPLWDVLVKMMYKVGNNICAAVDPSNDYQGIFDDCEINQLNISSIPISYTLSLSALVEKYNGDKDKAEEAYAEQFNKISYMEGYVPKCLVKFNIGSNVGLIRWLSRLQSRMLFGEYKGGYCAVKSDCNIFLRMISVRAIYCTESTSTATTAYFVCALIYFNLIV